MLDGYAAFAGERDPARELFAVPLLGDLDAGWLVKATTADEARRIVHGTDPRAGECAFGELLVWTAEHYRRRYFNPGGDFGPEWVRLATAADE